MAPSLSSRPHVLGSRRCLSAPPSLAVILGVSLAATAASATPMFQLVQSGTTPIQAEAVADPGGSTYTGTNGWPAGTGLPTAAGSWPLVSGTYPPGFGPDASFGGNYGITGFHSANLVLTEEALVTFEFGGSGNAVYQNRFFVGSTLVFDTKTASTNGPNMAGPYSFPAGLVPFTYVANVTGTGGSATYTIPNGSNTANPAVGAAFFIGFDPYAVAGTYTTSGTSAVYIGLSDRPEVVPDHDFQDLTVKVTIVGVPEPGAVALAVIGIAGGLVVMTRRRPTPSCSMRRRRDRCVASGRRS